MSVSEIANVSIDETSEGATLESFEIPAVLAGVDDTTPASYTEDGVRAKKYNLDDAGIQSCEDEWGANSAVMDQINAMGSQEPRAAEAYVIMRDAPVQIVKKITFTGTFNTGHSANVTVNGKSTGAIAYATSHANTLGLIATAITDLGEGIASAVDDDTDDITITAAEEWPLDVSVVMAGTSPPTAAVSTTTPGRTAADDIDDALAEDDTNEWYVCVPADSNKGLILALSERFETTEKYFSYATSEDASKTANQPYSLMSRIFDKTRRRTIGFWHHDLTEGIAAAAMSSWMADDPGSSQLALRALNNVTVSKTSHITPAEAAIVQSRGGNTYRKFGPFGAIMKGKRADGKVADATRDLDHARNSARLAVILYLTQTKKPPFDTDGGIAIKKMLEALALSLVEQKILRADKPITVITPDMTNLSPEVEESQFISGCKIKGTLLKGMLGAEITFEVGI